MSTPYNRITATLRMTIRIAIHQFRFGMPVYNFGVNWLKHIRFSQLTPKLHVAIETSIELSENSVRLSIVFNQYTIWLKKILKIGPVNG